MDQVEQIDIPCIERDEALGMLQQGACLLTVNTRLSTSLHAAYAEQQVESVWQTPDILPLSGWLSRQYDALVIRGIATAQLLQPAQESLLWEQVVDDWNAARNRDELLLRPSAAAASAQEAWRLMHDWCVDDDELACSAIPEARQFLQWRERIGLLCAQRDWITRSELISRITTAIEQGDLVPPGILLLAGFDELTRAQQLLLQAMLQQGADVRMLAAGQHHGEARRLLCTGSRQEIEQAAWWARRKLEAGCVSRIGIVVPQLHELRSTIEEVFDSVLHPESLNADHADRERIFNITLGTPLAHEPMVQDALLLLTLIARVLTFEEAGRLLRSHHVGGYRGEWQRRALLDLRLRKYAAPQVGRLKFLHALQNGMGDDTAACPAFAENLETAMALADNSKARTHAAWGESIFAMLEALGWPGERELDSREYQCRDHFKGLLESIGNLDIALSGVSYADAVSRLRRLARESLFQTEGGSEAPIQISGPLEAGGQHYDALWVLGVTDEVWPPAARPNPLLPVSLQKSRGLPHASPEREATYYRALHARLLASAPEILFSSSRRDGERELRPSPLIRTLPCVELPATGRRVPASLIAQAVTESLDDTSATPVDPASSPAGGSAILKEQASCPFQAFVHFRLEASRLEEPAPGFDPRSRGTLTHRALELLWQQIGSHARLAALGEEVLRTQIREAVATALGEEHSETGLRQHYEEIEQQRLERLLWRWLEFEKRREPFTVEETETGLEIELAGLRLSLRADRTDRLEDGRRVIIDYKTGRPFSPGWTTEHLEEPQLPLYAIASGEQPAAAVLAWANNRKTELSGLADKETRLPGVRQYDGDWNDLLRQWRASLTTTAAGFMQGHAAVDPADPARSCTWCDYRGMCRIDEHLAMLGESDDDASRE